MDEQMFFVEMLRGVRQGDGEAARKLIELYEAEVRRIIRVQLTDPRLRRQMDSVDICQSVMGDFFVRVGLGDFEVETPEQLIKLLATMARNKFLKNATKQRAECRDIRKTHPLPLDELFLAANEATPSQIVSNREFLRIFRERLTADERYLAEQRADGRAWQELAEELNEHSDTLRKRLHRGIDRVSEELGIET